MSTAEMSWEWVAWTLAGAAVLAGVLLLWLGRRRVRRAPYPHPTHPHCRRCGRDLYGLGVSAPSVGRVGGRTATCTTNCPECGVALTRVSVDPGPRQRRPRQLAAGMTLLLLSLGVVSTTGVARWVNVDWQSHKPVWLLLREGDAAAADEMLRRYQAGELSDDVVAKVAERYLEDQADPALPWVPEKGDVLIAMAIDEAITMQQWQRFVEEALAIGTRVRPRARSEIGVPFCVGLPLEPRLGTLPSKSSMERLQVDVWAVDRLGRVVAGGRHRIALLHVGAFSEHDFVPPKRIWSKGGIRLVADVSRTWPLKRPARPVLTLPFASRSLDRSLDRRPLAVGQVVPANEPTATAVSDAGLVRRVQSELRLSTPPSQLKSDAPAKIVATVRRHPDIKEKWVTLAELRVDVSRLVEEPRLPVTLAYDVVFRKGGRETVASSLMISRSSRFALIGLTSVPNAMPFTDKVDLIFRPSARVAEATLDEVEFLDAEVVMEDVPIAWEVNDVREARGEPVVVVRQVTFIQAWDHARRH